MKTLFNILMAAAVFYTAPAAYAQTAPQHGPDIEAAHAAVQAAPDDLDARLRLAQLLSWDDAYDQAQAQLDIIFAAEPDHVDARVVQGYLDYYQGRHAQAATHFRAALQQAPEYEDARLGLALVERAQRPEASQATWRIDAGHEYSRFSRENRESWHESHIHVGRAIENTGTVIHARGERLRRFGQVDSYVQAGFDHRFDTDANIYAAIGATPNADFYPRLRMLGGGGLSLFTPHTDGVVRDVRLTADLRHDHYRDADITQVAPGIRLSIAGNAALHPRLIHIYDSERNGSLWGWSVRGDIQVTDALGLYAGLGDAPETVAGETVNTFSTFTGLFFQLTPQYGIRTGWVREDRDNAYIRNAFHAGLSARF